MMTSTTSMKITDNNKDNNINDNEGEDDRRPGDNGRRREEGE